VRITASRETTPQDRVVRTWDGLPAYVSIETEEYQDLGDGTTRLVVTSQIYSTEEPNGVLNSEMEAALNESCAAPDRWLARLV